MKPFIITSILLLGVVSLTFSSEIYVSTTGSDSLGDGTIEKPYLTIEKAKERARELKSNGEVTVYLRGGTYYLSSPIIFRPEDSGHSTSNPITYRNYPGERVIISGGFKVTSPWSTTTLNGNTVYVTNIGENKKVDQLFLNGKRQIMARYPNYKPESILQGYAADALTKAGECKNPAEGPGYIRALHNSMWGGQSYYITGKNGNQVTYQWVGDNNRGSTMHDTYRMIENIIELLDSPGEWFYRKSTGELYFYPPKGTDMNTAIIELASLTELFRFVGTDPSSGASVKNIRLLNLEFTHTYRSLFDGTGQFYELVTASDWGIVRKGAIFLQNCENITIDHCLFNQLGGNGVFMSGYNRYNRVTNCHFKQIGASCVCLFGLRSSIRCPNAWPNVTKCDDRTPGPLTNEYPSYCTIYNNLMDTLGVFEKQTAGVTLSATEFDTIRHNTIRTMPRAGINICDGCWGGHVIDYNWVYDCVKETGDHGPFNSWGRDRNLIFGSSDVAASKLDARSTTIIRMNRFESPPGFFGIDLDDQSTNYYQEKNLCIGGGLKLQWHRYNTYVNNILVRYATVQFHGVWNNSNHYGSRNIIVGPLTCLYQVCCGSTPTNVVSSGTVWDSNLVYSPAGTPTFSEWSQGPSCGAAAGTWSQWVGSGMDVHSIIVDPMLADTQKVWTGRNPPYLPRGDFNPTNEEVFKKIRFQKFAMDSFGVIQPYGPQYDKVNISDALRRGISSLSSNIEIYLRKSVLIVSSKEEYTVKIITLDGKVVTSLKKKGNINLEHVLEEKKLLRSGTYLVFIFTKDNNSVCKRFVVTR